MKKALFFLLLAATVGMANAQFKVWYNTTDEITNDTAVVNVSSPDDDFWFMVNLENSNTSDFSGFVKADSTDANIRVVGMCAGECAVGRISPSITIQGGETYTEFHAQLDIEPGLPVGYTAKIKFIVNDGTDDVAVFWAKFVVASSSIAEAQQPSVLLYPNPAKDFVTLSLQNAQISANAKVQIVNGLGAVVKEQPALSEHLRVNVADMPAGVYACRITDGAKIVAVKKLIVR